MRKALLSTLAAVFVFAAAVPAFAQQQQEQPRQERQRDPDLDRWSSRFNEENGSRRSRTQVEDRGESGTRVTHDVGERGVVYGEGVVRETRPNDPRSGEVRVGAGVGIRFGGSDDDD